MWKLLLISVCIYICIPYITELKFQVTLNIKLFYLYGKRILKNKIIYCEINLEGTTKSLKQQTYLYNNTLECTVKRRETGEK